MKSAIVFAMIGLGLLMVALSGVWTSLFPGSSAWTDEKAKHWSEVKDRLNALSPIVNAVPGRQKMHGGPDPIQAKAEFEKLKAENEQLAADFTGTYNAPRTTSAVLKWGGISLAVVGLIGWYAVNQTR